MWSYQSRYNLCDRIFSIINNTTSKKIYIITHKKVAFYFRVWVQTKSRYQQKLDDARKTHTYHVNHPRLDDLYTPVKCHHEFKFESIPYMKGILFSPIQSLIAL